MTHLALNKAAVCERAADLLEAHPITREQAATEAIALVVAGLLNAIDAGVSTLSVIHAAAQIADEVAAEEAAIYERLDAEFVH